MEPAYEVSPTEMGDFDYEVTFSDEVAHEQEDRVVAFVEVLDREPRIAEAIHEDRESVLVRAPDVALPELESLVAGCWVRTAPH
jgi:hypothetical protein